MNISVWVAQYPQFFLTFTFEIILDLHKSCKSMTEVPVIYCLDSPLVNIIQNHNVFIKVKNELWYNTSN